MTARDSSTAQGLSSPTESNSATRIVDCEISNEPVSRKSIDLTYSTSTQSDTDQALMEAEVQSKQLASKTASIPEFRPYQTLFTTPITIYYGEDLTSSFTVHRELLLCYSKKLVQQFHSAQHMEKAYQAARSLRQTLKNVLCHLPNTPAESPMKMAVTAILKCERQYPLREYQINIRKRMSLWATEQFDKKMTLVPSSNGGIKKKTFDEYDLSERLQVLNDEGQEAVARALYGYLLRIKHNELIKARTDPVLAAAGRMIFVGCYDEVAVGSLVTWLYQTENLHYKTASDVCNLLSLSDKLGVQQLMSACLNMLANAAFDAIRSVKSHGQSLLVFFESNNVPNVEAYRQEHESLPGAVWQVFNYVLNHDNPQAVLREMVIDALADSRDIKFFAYMKPRLSKEISGDVTEAIMRSSGSTQLRQLSQHNVDSQVPYTAHDEVKDEDQWKKQWRGAEHT